MTSQQILLSWLLHCPSPARRTTSAAQRSTRGNGFSLPRPFLDYPGPWRHFTLLKLLAPAGTPGAMQDSTSGLKTGLCNPASGYHKACQFKMACHDSACHIWEVPAGLGNLDALFNSQHPG